MTLRRTRLTGDDAERFFAALDRKAGPNEAMRKLVADHADHVDSAAGAVPLTDFLRNFCRVQAAGDRDDAPASGNKTVA